MVESRTKKYDELMISGHKYQISLLYIVRAFFWSFLLPLKSENRFIIHLLLLLFLCPQNILTPCIIYLSKSFSWAIKVNFRIYSNFATQRPSKTDLVHCPKIIQLSIIYALRQLATVFRWAARKKFPGILFILISNCRPILN